MTFSRPRGAIVWFTGMPGSGKTTLAGLLAAELGPDVPVDVLDGDEVRRHLSRDLGFSKTDRLANAERVGFVARRLARHGVVVIVATISPYGAGREEARRLAAAEGIPFTLVFLDAGMDVLLARDAKGHYGRARAGELAQFTGVSDPYERPSDADVVVNTGIEPPAASAQRILAALIERGIVAQI